MDWTSLAIVLGAILGIIWTAIQRHRSTENNEMMLRQAKSALLFSETISERITENGDKIATSLGVADWTTDSNSEC